MRIEEFDYELPPGLIAQAPAADRSASRLLVVDRNREHPVDARFLDLPDWLRPGDLLVFNDTRVIKARLAATRSSGGRVELLIERIVAEDRALAQGRASNPLRPGTRLTLASGSVVEVIARHDALLEIAFGEPVSEVLERDGEIPLPPYIERDADEADAQRYQTVYARHPGAVAAPTAGLHFDRVMLERLQACGMGSAHVTLHVGAGTFSPVRVTEVSEHRMHSEWYCVPQETVDAIERAHSAGARVVAVGTTSLRALESAARAGALRACAGETDLFILPGFEFRVVDLLLTNFHLPRSTLLMLVSAFAGRAAIWQAYAHAVEQQYRFFSYGDAMLLQRAPPESALP